MKESSNVEIEGTHNLAMLTVKKATRADAGLYNLTLTNDNGVTDVQIITNVLGELFSPFSLTIQFDISDLWPPMLT